MCCIGLIRGVYEPPIGLFIWKLPGRVVLFRLALSWLVQVLKSVAGAAFSEKGSVFCGFSDTGNYLVQYFVRTTFTGCRPSLWQMHLRT